MGKVGRAPMGQHGRQNKPFKPKGRKMGHKNKKMKKNIFDKNARLIVRNLSFKTTEENLKKHFETYGKIADVNLLKRPNGELVGCGFVQFEEVEEAKRALSNTNSKPFLGRSVHVDWALPKEQYVENTKGPTLTQMNNSVEIKSEPESDDELDSNLEIKQEKRGFQRKQRKDADTDGSDGLKINAKTVKKGRLIVRNISFKATEESFKGHFAPYGEVLEATLLKKPNGELVGCGFIQMKNAQGAAKAIIKTNAHPFLGRPIHVDWAVAKNKYMSYITQKNDEEELLKNEVKSEPESDEEPDKRDISLQDVSVKEESNSDSDIEEEDSKDSDSGSDVESDDEQDDHKPKINSLKVSANDAEDGKTIFLKNVPFSVTNEDLEVFVKPFGEIQYALVCIDKLKEHSKGTAFVRFKNKEDADIMLSSGSDRRTVEGQVVEALPAMLRDNIKGKNTGKKQPSDARNLYLIREGVILASSKAAIDVSASDIAKRLSLEQSKSQMLRNLNRFISRYRLTIHNIPLHYGDDDLKKICLEMANAKPFCLKECRVMRHLKGPMGPNGKHVSKGFGFVTFTKHEDALTCLRRLNNHPGVFDKNNRPIVSFSIEDKAVLNARSKRLEKSKIRNPLSKSYVPAENEQQQLNDNKKFNNKTEKHNGKKEFSKFKGKSKQINDSQNNSRQKFVNETYVGEESKPGNVRMRSKFKLKTEALLHRENVKKEKKKKRAGKKAEFMRKKEKLKQPRQKQNTSIENKRKVLAQRKDDKNFSDLVNKYKSKLVSSSNPQRVKSKWFEQS